MKPHFLIFVPLVFLVVFLHFTIDARYFDFGMHSDDWISLVRYKSLETDFLEKAQIFWKRHGPHVTSQIIYMGLLENSFGLNYQLFAKLNIAFKILATLSLYPLIFLVFKNRLLAFLTVILYAMSYSTVGTFHDVHKGTEYMAIIFMNVFLSIYYYISKKKVLSWKWALALFFSFSLSIMLAPPRLFPLTLLPLMIEFFLWAHNRKGYDLKFGSKKMLILYLPFILLFLYHPVAVTGAFVIPQAHLQKIIEGYWYTILSPISGLGYMNLWGSHWIKLIGTINTVNFSSYISSLIFPAIFSFGVITITLSFIFAKKKMLFISCATVVNFIFISLTFFLSTRHLILPVQGRINFDFNALPSIFIGFYILTIALFCYLEWRKNQFNRLLLAFWLGSFLSFYFVFCNWVFGDTFLFFSPSQEYLTVPAIGICLMIASILSSYYEKLKGIPVLKGTAIATLFLVFIPIYSINYARSTDFIFGIVKRNNAPMQRMLHQEVKEKIQDSSVNGDRIVFFDISGDPANGDFYSETIHSSFPSWIHYYNGAIIEGCMNEIMDKKTLAASLTKKDGKTGFILQGVCVKKPMGEFYLKQNVFYSLDNFYAFAVNQNKLTDIKEEVLNQMGVN